MRYLFIPFQWLWRTFFFVNFALTFLLFYPLFFLFLSRRRWFPLVFKTKRLWGRFILYPAGLFFSVQYRSKLDLSRAYVICPNHTSYIDVVLTYVILPCYFHSMGKAELLKIPLFNRFFKRMNIPVNRKSTKDSHRAYLRAGEDMDRGISINLYPEGTIGEQVPVLGRFKNGPFRLAIEKQAPIIPITYLNNWLLLPGSYSERGGGRPGIAHIIVHEPVETKGMTEENLETLKQQVHDIIAAPLRERYPDYFTRSITQPLPSTRAMQV